jgi:hypothetical protein
MRTVASLASRKSIEAELAVLNDPVTRDEQSHIVAFIAALQDASSPEAFYTYVRSCATPSPRDRFARGAASPSKP